MTEMDANNDNKKLENGRDPDCEYVRDYLQAALAHFEDCKIDQKTILEGMGDAMVYDVLGLLKTWRTLDESDLWRDLSFLQPFHCTIGQVIKRRHAAIGRVEAERAARNVALSESAD